MIKAALPSKSIALLMVIGFTDLISTACLHHAGLIREMNPIMRVVLDQGEWLFVLVKSATLVAAWLALRAYAKRDPQFVQLASIGGSAVYLTLWTVWFLAAR